jgi:D-alanyl-lipoteichoic acid acyltransferase DltB (MBOAT superfamily)
MITENIIFYSYICFIFLLLYITYLNAKKYPKITLENLAFCLILFSFQITILTIAIQFYLIWKLYFNCVINVEEKQDGNNNIDK